MASASGKVNLPWLSKRESTPFLLPSKVNIMISRQQKTGPAKNSWFIRINAYNVFYVTAHSAALPG